MKNINLTRFLLLVKPLVSSTAVVRQFASLLAVLLIGGVVSPLSLANNPSALTANEQGIILSIHGSNTLGAKLVPTWAKDYMLALGLDNVRIEASNIANEFNIVGSKAGRDYTIHIAAHGSSTGFKGIAAGKAHVAMASRPIKTKESDKLKPFGDMRSYDAEKVVAIDGLAVVINKANPIRSLTIKEIAQIFSGQLNNWAQVGGENLPISLYARDKNSGTWDTFKSLVLKRNKSTLDASAKRFESNDQLSDLVAMDPGAIGFVGLASVRQAKALAVADGETAALAPETLYVATEDYPLSRRLYLYLPPVNTHPRARDFVEFTQSLTHQQRVAEIGFVSLNPVSEKAVNTIDGPEPYRKLSEIAERLSVNFRFNEGSAALDNRALRDIERISEYIDQPENSNKVIQLVGFGDLKQSEERSVLLSKLRASAVKSALHKHGVSTRPVAGFGAYMPVATQDQSNRTKNQRVEVWIIEKELVGQLQELKKGASTRRQSDVVYFSI